MSYQHFFYVYKFRTSFLIAVKHVSPVTGRAESKKISYLWFFLLIDDTYLINC